MPLQISEKLRDMAARAEDELAQAFARVERIAQHNTEKVLSAFQTHRVAEGDFVGTTGYGYDDQGRDKLEAIYADIFGTEDALVRLNFVNGTHAITAALFGVLRPGDTLVSGVGAPYDTMLGVIGVADKGPGSLKDYGVNYCQVELLDNKPDIKGMAAAVKKPGVRAILLQRSRGYATRASLSVEQLGEMCDAIRRANSDVAILVDNCYGEFVEELEPTQVGADLVVGSLIKNPGGGLAPTGGYLAGHRELIEGAASRLTAPGIGKECGCTLGHDRALYQGLFLAPQIVREALCGARFAAEIFSRLGFGVSPGAGAKRGDIVEAIRFGDPRLLIAFCQGIQRYSAVDSYVTPEPWDMPGYTDQVIMASGSFVSGSSIEISADAPVREPYVAYFQGGLSRYHAKIAITRTLYDMEEAGLFAELH